MLKITNNGLGLSILLRILESGSDSLTSSCDGENGVSDQDTLEGGIVGQATSDQGSEGGIANYVRMVWFVEQAFPTGLIFYRLL